MKTQTKILIGGSVLVAAAGTYFLWKKFKPLPKKVQDKLSAFPKFKEVSQKLGINPSFLYYVIQKESGWNPKAVNPTGGATGLIQFMPATARGLGTNSLALLGMNTSQQLDYVYKYLAPYKSRLKNIADVYLTVFYPYAAGKPDSYIIGSEKSPSYAKLVAAQNNPKWDLNKNATLTKGEFKRSVKQDAKKMGII